MGISRKLGRLVGKGASLIADGGKAIGGKVRDLRDPANIPEFVKAARFIESTIKKTQHNFDWDQALAQLGASKSEHKPLARLVYHRALKRSWSDTILEQHEIEYLEWLSERIPLDKQTQTRMRKAFESDAFDSVMTDVLHDDHISEEEMERLDALSASLGDSISALATQFFRENGARFIEQSMEKMIHSRDDGLDCMRKEWDHVQKATNILGLARQDVLRMVKPGAEKLLEHVIVDAKADDRLWPHEEEGIRWVLTAFDLSDGLCRYAEEQMEILRVISELTQGRLPSISQDEVCFELDPSEIVHFYSECCEASKYRMLKSGPRVDSYEGEIAITNIRVWFDADDEGLTVAQNLRSIPKVKIHRDGIGYVTKNGSMGFHFSEDSTIVSRIFRMAVDNAKGRKSKATEQQGDFLPTRHISQSVRQRVWVDYGGRCAECNADHYLEYDHIIPHSRGGSNDFENIQLLCRGCNQRKSNKI
jgi:hypothetical protein